MGLIYFEECLMAHFAVAPSNDPLARIEHKLDALSRLESLIEDKEAEKKRHKSDRFVRLALKSWRNGSPTQTAKCALRATQLDPSNARAFHVLATSLQRMGYTHKALVTFEHAFKLDPGDSDILIDIGISAWRMKMYDVAKQLFCRYIEARPDAPLGYNNLGSLMAEQGDIDGGIDIVRSALLRMPHHSILWHALATMLAEDGRAEEALVFYREAIRLDPDVATFQHNLGYALLHLGMMPEALDCYERALKGLHDPIDNAEARHSRGICLIGMGRLEEGFEGYETRLDPRFREYIPYAGNAPLWNGEPLEGKHLLVFGEQGLGDEIMFANMLPDLVDAVGPNGHLQIAVDGRLASLFRRSFPQAEIGTLSDRRVYHGEGNQVVRFANFGQEQAKPDYYVPIASTLHILRTHIEDFPHKPVLKPDPERVAHYREILKAGGDAPTIGICWRSMMLGVARQKYYTTLDTWKPILQTPGVRYVNLQYGDCADDLKQAVAAHGVPIEVIEGLDLKLDIEGAAALSAALDLVISAPTAAAAIAGSVGTEVWFLTACVTWPQLGTSEYPWYRKTRAFVPERFRDWPSLIPKVADELAVWVAERR
jgi:tetratricopeptide (TPR) repeat protein